MLPVTKQKIFNEMFKRLIKGHTYPDHETLPKIIDGPISLLRSRTHDAFDAEELLIRNIEIYARGGFKKSPPPRYKTEKLGKISGAIFVVVDTHDSCAAVPGEVYLTESEAKKAANRLNKEDKP